MKRNILVGFKPVVGEIRKLLHLNSAGMMFLYYHTFSGLNKSLGLNVQGISFTKRLWDLIPRAAK